MQIKTDEYGTLRLKDILFISGYKKLFPVHVIIAEVFLGPKPDKHVVDRIIP